MARFITPVLNTLPGCKMGREKLCKKREPGRNRDLYGKKRCIQ